MVISNIGPNKIILITLGFLFCLEQLFCFFAGSYPYIYGLTVKRILLKNPNFNCPISKRLKVKKNTTRNEFYLHYRYPFGVVAPLIFIGVIKEAKYDMAEIKMGPLSLVFLIYIAAKSIALNGFISFGNFIIVSILILFIYHIFVREVRVLGESPD